MLDYQINESISRAYSESVCGYKCHRNKKSEKNRVNEDNNVVARVSMPVSDVRRGAELNRRSKLTPEELEREDRQRRRWAKEYAKRQRQKEYESIPKTYMSAAPERPKRPETTISSREDYNRAQMRAAQSTDPGMRIGRGVYDGLGYMLPGAMVGKFTKGAEIAKELSSQGARIAALEQGAARGGGGVMKWMLSPKGNVAGAALGTAANYGSDKLRKRGYDKTADVVDEFKWLGAMPGPIGYGASNIGYNRFVRNGNGSAAIVSADGEIQQNGGSASVSSDSDNVWGTKVRCNANEDGTGCGFVAANQTELDKHYETCPLLK